MVMSTLEYGSSVWDLYLQKDIDNVERVNRRAARFVLGDTGNRAACQWWLRSWSGRLLNIVGRIKGLPLCSRLSMVLWQCRPHLTDSRTGATISTSSNASCHKQLHTEILFTLEQSPVERPWQRICLGDFHRLLQESLSLVRRGHSSTWYPISGVYRLRPRSRAQNWSVAELRTYAEKYTRFHLLHAVCRFAKTKTSW